MKPIIMYSEYVNSLLKHSKVCTYLVLNACVPPRLPCWSLSLEGGTFRDGSLGGIVYKQGHMVDFKMIPMVLVSFLQGKKYQKIPPTHTQWGHSVLESAICNPEEGISSGNWICLYLKTFVLLIHEKWEITQSLSLWFYFLNFHLKHHFIRNSWEVFRLGPTLQVIQELEEPLVTSLPACDLTVLARPAAARGCNGATPTACHLTMALSQCMLSLLGGHCW